jgi:ABC-type glutathione transport system ATPase component
MDEKFEDVASFADIGEFLEEPVKTYSSGMMTRLAFAVSTCVEPEILIIDEALSVGDAPFQAKCFRRLRQLIDDGVSLLFVSHDLGTVRSVCERAMWLKDGECANWGAAKNVAREYEKFCWKEQGIPFDDETSSENDTPSDQTEDDPASSSTDSPTAAAAPTSIAAMLEQDAADFKKRAEAGGRIGTGTARFSGCVLTNPAGARIERVDFNQEAVWHAEIVARDAVNTDVVIGLAIFNVKGERIAGVQNVHDNLRLKLEPGESTRISIKMRFPFTHEKYSARLTLMGFQDGDRTINGVYDFNRGIILDQVTDARFFEVDLHTPFPIGPAVCLPGEISLQNDEEAKA